MSARRSPFFALLPVALGLGWFASEAPAGAGEWQWLFSPKFRSPGYHTLPETPPGHRAARDDFAPASFGSGLILNGDADVVMVAEQVGSMLDAMPRAALSVEAWVAIERPQRWGGIVSCVQDNGDYEKGFVLGYDDQHFTFGLATTGMDDGDGRMSYFTGRTAYHPGRWHHVAATFDGTTTRLYVDGALDLESTIQHGEVLYDPSSPFLLGAYRDQNENYPLDGRIKQVSMEDRAWSANEVRERFDELGALTEIPAWTDMEFGFLVEPYLTWPTQDAISIGCETTFPSTAQLWIRRDDQAPEAARMVEHRDAQALHVFRVEGLDPHQKYFYRIRVEGLDDAQEESDWLSFRTAAGPQDAFTFAVMGDTQTHGEVAKRVSDLAYEHRPNLLVHCGDLVDTGGNKRDWTDTFFPSMQPLLGRVPMMPVLGNHEQDAQNYYDYMSLPEPERWYSFRYGNAEFFMIDGNRSLADQSAQLAWLESALSASRATWRFAVLHQPPYTSDSNDYGDTLLSSSTRGDLNVRNIVALLEKYDVDLCFSGHVHDYERTFPIREGAVQPYREGGVIYVTAAGGGGSLEDFDPANTWFGHKKARRHHFVYVAIHGDQLEFQAVDEDGRLFDQMTLRKR